jgi:DNA-binding GntR family transcriptional regulator
VASDPTARQTPSERVYTALRVAVLHGDFSPGQPLKPQELADRHGASLAVARESLLRLVGEGLAERLPNRGFAVPAIGADHWQQLAQARTVVEPVMLRMSITFGDLDWEVRVRAAHHRLAGTPPFERTGDAYPSDAWSAAHRDFHRTLLEACGNDVLLDTFDRLWTASELARRWSAAMNPGRDAIGEHLALEEAALARDADRATELLVRHVEGTASRLIRPGDAQGTA